MRTRIPLASRRHRFAALLALLLASLAIQSFDTQPGVERMLADVVRTVLVVAICVVVFERRRERISMAGIAGVNIAIGWWRHFSPASLDYALSVALYALTTMFLSIAVGMILRDLFRARAVGADTVLGAICGYLIAGDAWGAVNAFTYMLVPAAYSVNPDVGALLADLHDRLALFSYYGFTQVLTIGYADVTPVRAPATTLSLFAALFGVFYTAVVVSQFVTLAQSGTRETSGDR